jgi:hypothetical protein
LLFVAPVLPWLYRNWLVTGNPVYPMFSSIIPTRDWSAEQARTFGLFFRYYNWAKASGSRLGELQRKELLLFVALCFLVTFVIAVLRTKRRPLRDLLVFAAVILMFALWLTGLYFRFWLPALMCLALFVGRLCADRWSERTLTWSAVLVLIAGLSLLARSERDRFSSELRMVTGQSSREQEYRDIPLWNTWSYINSTTPKDAHVLVASFVTTFGISSGGAFWAHRPCYTTDSHVQGFIQFGDWTAFVTAAPIMPLAIAGGVAV